jgi:hypothetical protein
LKFFFIGSEENYNELRFTGVGEWQKYMNYGTSIKNIWQPPRLEYIYGNKSKRNKQFDLSQCCDPLFTITEKTLSILENILNKNGEILEIEYPKGFFIVQIL